jgi:hypothetical protein
MSPRRDIRAMTRGAVQASPVAVPSSVILVLRGLLLLIVP